MIQIVFLTVLAIIAVGVIVLLHKDKAEPTGNNSSGGGSACEEHEKGDGHEKVDDKDHDQDRMDE